MLITQAIEVDQPIDAVWKFFDDIPQVAACIPGANLTDQVSFDAAGADKKGRGSATAVLTAVLAPAPRGTKVDISLELEISGAAAQYGRGLVNDVTAVLVTQTADSMQARLRAIAMGLDPNAVVGAQPASGLAIGFNAFMRALVRVFKRFFMPYVPVARR